MGFKYAKQNNLFVIDSKWTSVWIFYFITILGFFVCLIAWPILIKLILKFDGDFLTLMITGFASFLGLIFFWTGLRSPAKGYSEKITFSIDTKVVDIVCKKQPRRNLRVSFTDIIGVHVSKKYKSSGSSNSTRYPVFHLYLVFANGATFWLVSNSNSRDRIDKLVEELRIFTLLTLSEIDSLEISAEQVDLAESLILSSAYESMFMKSTYESDGQYLSVRKPKIGFWNGLMILLVLMIFLLAPAGPLLVSRDATGSINIFIIIFVSIFGLFWYAIVLTVVLFQLRRVRVIRSGTGFELELKFLFLSFMNRRIGITTDHLLGFVIHRVEEGHYVLVAHLKDALESNLGWLLSRSLSPQTLPYAESLAQSRTILPIARVDGWNLPGKGPLLEDLLSLKLKLRL